MRFCLVNILTLLVFVCGSVLAQRSRGGSVSNPAGYRSVGGAPGYRSRASRGTVPQGSGSGLLKSPNPLGTQRGNLMITGNVRGGRYFRGVVPYSSTTTFNQSLGTTDLDSFRRDSTSVADVTGSASSGAVGITSPFYSSTGTVTGLRPGYRNVFSPSSRVNYYQSGLDTSLDLRSRRILEDNTQPNIPLNQYRPMTPMKKDMDKLFARDSEEFIRYQSLVDNRYKRQRERLKLRVEDAAERAKGLLKGPQQESPLAPETDEVEVTEDTTGIPGSVKIRPTRKTPEIEKINTEDSRYLYARLQREKKNDVEDVFEKMQRDIDELKEIMATQEMQRKVAKAEAEKQKKQEKGDKAEKEGLAGTFGDVELLIKKATEQLKSYDSFASMSDDRFNVYMRVGEEYMKKGRFYMAANAYKIASVYKPENPLANAGRCHALFAAGEYLSSALFLSRTLEMFPEYAALKIDFEAMVGDKDKLETRVANAEEIIRITEEMRGESSGELQFLLAYVYHQMGIVEKAKSNIEEAYDKMPDSKAVVVLKKVIDATEETPLK